MYGQGAGGDLVLSGQVLDREEIWDRRGHPLMGRPDFLKEVILRVRPLEVLKGRLGSPQSPLRIHAKGQALIQARRALPGSSGVLTLGRAGSGWELVRFELSTAAPAPSPTKVRPWPTATPLAFPEDLDARQVKASPELQERAKRAIARKHRMTEVSVLFLTSFQGPMPPEGGYLYWGVKGKIRGQWHIWQPGRGAKPRPGEQLEDPKRHQK